MGAWPFIEAAEANAAAAIGHDDPAVESGLARFEIVPMPDAIARLAIGVVTLGARPWMLAITPRRGVPSTTQSRG